LKTVFLTGHTGFKGAWFTTLLSQLGHKVHGFSDTARQNSLYRKAGIAKLLESEVFGDVRDFDALKVAVSKSGADLVVHFAAQPIVLKSYEDPVLTFEANINGTLNTLEASYQTGCPRVLIITTDKVYKDIGKTEGYSEGDALQGWDPYAASKAGADILAQSWLELHRSDIRVDIARGGNVIAGGDDSDFRLVPEIERAIVSNDSVRLRNSSQVRPWQHALDCLDGYLAILQKGGGDLNTWNVGPLNDDATFTSREFTQIYLEARGSSANIVQSQTLEKETDFLRLDTTQIQRELGWRPKLSSEEAISLTANWHKRVQLGEGEMAVTRSQVDEYLERIRI
jgi:CDP-glucose 4,6-dehydratase